MLIGMRSQRINEIKEYIYMNKTVTLDQICAKFKISKSTLRRDLDQILSAEDIQKIYGGVTVIPRKELISFEERNVAHPDAKKRIALSAAGLVEDGDIIFIDSGTTTPPLIEAIRNKKNLTVLTNSVEIIIRAIPYNEINVISLSGALNRKTLSFTDSSAVQVLKNYNISKAFMSATGFSVLSGVMNSSPLETDIKRTAIQRSQQVFLLADSSKCGVVSLLTYCSLKEVDVLITEAAPSAEVMDFMQNNGKKVLIAP
jgi:DeoR family transcriptional regulator, myo-inositol catabolism operon repressor